MPRRTPLTPIFDPDISRGAIVVGNTPGSPVGLSPLIDVDWRGLTEEPSGWLISAHLQFSADGIWSNNPGFSDQASVDADFGEFTTATIAVAAIDPIGDGNVAYLQLTSPSSEVLGCYLNLADGIAAGTRDDGVGGEDYVEVNDGTPSPVSALAIVRWSVADDVMAVRYYPPGASPVDDLMAESIGAFTPDTFSVTTYTPISEAGHAYVQRTTLWGALLSDEQCDDYASTWGWSPT